ncbi:acyl-CoA dehydrogenase family protein [Lysinibacillus sp. KU-BSD001]|uniref:acyl-CoA dehydrogenase family protein n=1 Tax=Lysinibacillus sp. KU-BSD001 TaxID=3141328 RepID=UPI0036EE6879
MDFHLNDIQKEFKQTARKFFKEKCGLEELRAFEGNPHHYSEKLYQELVELGFVGLVVPEQYGGFGGEFLDLALVIEEAGWSLFQGPFLSTIVSGVRPLVTYGTDTQKSNLLPAFADGTSKASYAIAEPQAHYKLEHLSLGASSTGNHYVLNGTKLFVPFAKSVDKLFVIARTDQKAIGTKEGLTVFLVDTATQGIEVKDIPTISADGLCEVRFHEVKVSAAQIVGNVGDGFDVASDMLTFATALKCIEMTGVLSRTVDITADYVKERHQFNVPIGSFQSVQHRLADMFTIVEGGRLAAFHAFSRLVEGKDAKKEVAIAKAWLSQEGQKVVTGAHQLHGGMGIDYDYPLQFCFRRFKGQQLEFGTPEMHLQNLGQWLATKPQEPSKVTSM